MTTSTKPRIGDPTIEILAILLMEHGSPLGSLPPAGQNWRSMTEDQRKHFRDMAAGEIPLYEPEPQLDF